MAAAAAAGFIDSALVLNTIMKSKSFIWLNSNLYTLDSLVRHYNNRDLEIVYLYFVSNTLSCYKIGATNYYGEYTNYINFQM